jgi:hypothetical protein
MSVVLLRVSPTAHADIWKRIQALGPEYERDFFRFDKKHGPVVLIREPIGLIKDEPTIDELLAAGPTGPQFVHKTYRCEWVAEVYQVDQYDRRQPGADYPLFYEKAWPTREQALADLEAVTAPDPHVPDRRRFPNAPHDYYSCGVRYREVEEK